MNHRPGFTLMELLVYLGISSIVILVLTKFAVDVTANASRNKASLEVQSSVRLAMAKMTESIRTAKVVCVPPPSGETLTLTNSDCSTPSASYVLSTSGQTAGQITTGAGQPITGPGITVSPPQGLSIFSLQNGVVTISITAKPTQDQTPAVQPQTLTTAVVPRSSLY